MKRTVNDWRIVKSDVLGYLAELGWIMLYIVALFILTWFISVIPW